jgi:hypothetical protein
MFMARFAMSMFPPTPEKTDPKAVAPIMVHPTMAVMERVSYAEE